MRQKPRSRCPRPQGQLSCEVGVKEQLGLLPLHTLRSPKFTYTCSPPPPPCSNESTQLPLYPLTGTYSGKRNISPLNHLIKLRAYWMITMKTIVSKLCWVYNLLSVLIAAFTIGSLAIGTVWRESWHEVPSLRASRASTGEQITPKYYIIFHSNLLY